MRLGLPSAASEETNGHVHGVAIAVEEMSYTVKEISKNLQEGTRITMEAVKMAESTNTTMSKLDRSSTEVGEVIKVITSIAQQTNLLALNGTIEAARAGEAGKGFAVVANEVKDLAKGTGKALRRSVRRLWPFRRIHGMPLQPLEKLEELSTKSVKFQLP